MLRHESGRQRHRSCAKSDRLGKDRDNDDEDQHANSYRC